MLGGKKKKRRRGYFYISYNLINEKFKKIALSGIVVLAFVFYAIHEKNEGVTAVSNINTVIDTKQANGTSSNISQAGKFKDGQYISSVADAFFGPLQIKTTISNGNIIAIEFLQYPNDRSTSIEISNASLPVLRSEAIASQNAQVDIVSGATQTSEAFRQALQETLDKANL